jgi:hypothetical protein
MVSHDYHYAELAVGRTEVSGEGLSETSTWRLKYFCGRIGGKRGEQKRCKKGPNQRN